MTASHNLPTEAGNYSQPENPRSVPKRAETGTVAADVVALTIGQAAVALDLPESTLQFWISRKGCPVARKGGRGRGRATMIDVAAVRAWMAGRDQPATTAPTTERDVMRAYAERLPDLLAQAMFAAYCAVESPAKRQLAASVAVAWYRAASQELDRLRDLWPDVPHVTTVPETINKLKLIV